MRIFSLADYEASAKRRLPKALFGFAAHGSEDERTLRANHEALDALKLIPRVLRDVSERSTCCELFGSSYGAPFGIAPMGGAALFQYRCDESLAKGAYEQKIPFVLSAASSIPLEQICACAPGSWYQAYIPADHNHISALLERLRRASIDVLVVTADVPVASNRDKDARLGFKLPLNPTVRQAVDFLKHPRWLAGVAVRTLLQQGVPHFENYAAKRGASIVAPPNSEMRAGRDKLTWRELAFIRERWQGTLLLKGVLSPDDAQAAIRIGVDGLIISNHGGRQLDCAVSSIEALRSIVPQRNGIKLLVDGGFRRGADIIKALALGADFVFIGRPFLYAASVDATEGVIQAIQLLRTELSTSMALLGVTAPGQVGPQHISISGGGHG